MLRARSALHLRSGWAGAVVIAAMVSACALGSDAPSTPPSAALTSSEPASPPSVEASPPEETPLPTPPATPQPTATPPVSVDLVPVDGTALPIAGRDGAPGAISCNGLGQFTYEWLLAQPTGAEKLPGPEFDVLRATIERYGNDSEFGFDGLTFREGHRDAAKVVFLGDRGGPEGPFAHIDVAFDGATWKWAGMSGGCRLVGEPGDGWGNANWVIDPAFDRPTSKTRSFTYSSARPIAIRRCRSPAGWHPRMSSSSRAGCGSNYSSSSSTLPDHATAWRRRSWVRRPPSVWSCQNRSVRGSWRM